MKREDGTVGFLGAGNMASALVQGILESGTRTPETLGASDMDREKLESISNRFGIRVFSNNRELVRDSSTVILCVKPQQLEQVLEEARNEFREDHLVISIAAGVPLERIRSVIGKDLPLVRVMPNTPALIQMGMSALARGSGAGPEHMALARALFDAAGETVEVEEAMMDAVTAVSGSGPGYIFRIMDAMVEGGAAVGLDREISLKLVIQTFLGAAQLAKSSEESLSRLREMVTSPGGTTAAGLEALDAMGLEEMMGRTVEAAYRRSLELGKKA